MRSLTVAVGNKIVMNISTVKSFKDTTNGKKEYCFVINCALNFLREL